MKHGFRLATMSALIGIGLISAWGCKSTAPESSPGATEPTAVAVFVTPSAVAEGSPVAPSDVAAELIAAAFAGVPGIVDPANHAWPREVEGLNGRVTILQKPNRIINASVGHDEVTFALVPATRVVGVGASTQNPTYSNVADKARAIAVISTDPEVIAAQTPDIIVTSPFFPSDTVNALTRLGIPVIQITLSNDPESRINDILLMGYIYGEEERALVFASEVSARYAALVAITQSRPPFQRPRGLALAEYFDNLWTAGYNSTEGSILIASGATNAAAEAGIEGNQTTSLEGVIAMNPDFITIAQPPDFGAEEFKRNLLANPALVDVPAIAAGAVFLVEGRYFTTLSFWNLIGVEQLGRLLWPDDFSGVAFPPFSQPSGG
ncbi:MAG: ABC transporter substrate-binding protein [Chloroflexi bacterium]|nr:ABC transporter substrate-binding protein [Chloroflexota bacterium]